MKISLKRILASPVLIISVAFALRMVLLFLVARAEPTPVRANLPYGYELGRVARAIAAGEGFSSPLRDVNSGPTVWFTPLYPYFIAAIFKIWGIYTNASKFLILTLNCAFASLTIIPIQAIARRVFGAGAAVTAAWIWVILPTALFFPIVWLWDTTLVALLFALIFWATLAMRERRDTLAWAGYGALWVFSGLVNPSILSVFPFLLGWLAWEARKAGVPWLKPVAAALLVFAIGLVPWTIRNYRVFGKFIVLRSNFGLELWLGNSSTVTDTMSQWAHPNDNPDEAAKFARMGEIAYMADKEREALGYIRTHPADTLNFVFRRFVDNWLGASENILEVWSNGGAYGKSFIVENVSLSLLCLLGVLCLSRERRPEAVPFGLVLLVFPLIFYITHSSLRYRFPIDPIMTILAAGALAHVASLAQARIAGTSKAAPAPLASAD